MVGYMPIAENEWNQVRQEHKYQGWCSNLYSIHGEIQLITIFEQRKISYHTYNKSNNREIRAIFKSVAEELDPTEIAEELEAKGYHPRVVARFKYKDKKPMPIILVIVPSYKTGIKDITSISEMQVSFEYQRRRKRLGQCYNCQRFGHSASNCRADPVCRHCAGDHESIQHNKDENTSNKCKIVKGRTSQITKDARILQK
ncbi:hypothetical protein JTB14_028266 [Gonioctena quinquepunctata]|nr:hypothetical protein JTB14_028266 [Gonioctena quinquepunctata]